MLKYIRKSIYLIVCINRRKIAKKKKLKKKEKKKEKDRSKNRLCKRFKFWCVYYRVVGHKFVRGEGRTKICPTETESARLLLYKIDLISVHKGLENITCIIWHILYEWFN